MNLESSKILAGKVGKTTHGVHYLRYITYVITLCYDAYYQASLWMSLYNVSYHKFISFEITLLNKILHRVSVLGLVYVTNQSVSVFINSNVPSPCNVFVRDICEF